MSTATSSPTANLTTTASSNMTSTISPSANSTLSSSSVFATISISANRTSTASSSMTSTTPARSGVQALVNGGFDTYNNATTNPNQIVPRWAPSSPFLYANWTFSNGKAFSQHNVSSPTANLYNRLAQTFDPAPPVSSTWNLTFSVFPSFDPNVTCQVFAFTNPSGTFLLPITTIDASSNGRTTVFNATGVFSPTVVVTSFNFGAFCKSTMAVPRTLYAGLKFDDFSLTYGALGAVIFVFAKRIGIYDANLSMF
ncbi:hypothetical protein K402DRAFT_460310 [Aulographum hederae CBS 113979]|uniref:Uncharacterized protein n=1 Tax=Aulographum hederae CBS 113979 TaxID=1176131 RepID=A0A6G1HD13_9PEZI|nr:hypothetical protein K402DRAFT_460310 [Aulographum hederae CBS 113979]